MRDWPLLSDFTRAPNNTCFRLRYPDLGRYPGFGSNTSRSAPFIDWLHAQGLRTFFNDHAWPVANQTDPAEVGFRWDGLTSWMELGLDFWWLDDNWGFGILPPTLGDAPAEEGHAYPTPQYPAGRVSWEGLDNRVWGSHVYYSGPLFFFFRLLPCISLLARSCMHRADRSTHLDLTLRV